VPVRVRIPTIMRGQVGGEPVVRAEGRTVRALLEDLEARYPGIKRSIVDDDGALHRFVNVYVNDEDVRFLGAMDAPVGEGDTVSILPAVAGGCQVPGAGSAVRPGARNGGLAATT
jgi:molybdopterin synthase sulfur carrier subunit